MRCVKESLSELVNFLTINLNLDAECPHQPNEKSPAQTLARPLARSAFHAGHLVLFFGPAHDDLERIVG
jgi:hypothetical protein